MKVYLECEHGSDMGRIYFVSSQLCSPTWTCNASGMRTVVEKSLHQCASVHIGEQRDMKVEIVRAVLTEMPTPPEAIYELVYDKDTDELEGITGNICCDCKRPISGRAALAGAGGNAVLSERKEGTERGDTHWTRMNMMMLKSKYVRTRR